MKKLATIILLTAITLVAMPVHAESGYSGNVNAILGSKRIDNDNVDHRNLTLFGIMYDFNVGDLPFNLAIDGLFAGRTKEMDVGGGNEVEVDVGTFELGFGVRRDFMIPDTSLYPFIGAGLSYSALGVDQEDVDDDGDTALGRYFTTGLFYNFDNGLNLGLVYRYSRADVELELQGDEIRTRAGGHHYAIMFGKRW